MRIGLRLAVLLAVVGVLPLAGLGLAVGGAVRSWLVSSNVDFQVRSAELLASVIARQLNDTERVLQQQMANFELGSASPQSQQAFLITTYRLFPELSAVFLTNAAGQDLVPPVFQSPDGPVEVAGHPLVEAAELAAIRAALPVAADGATAWAPPRPASGDAPASLVGSIASPWGDGTRLGVDLALTSVATRMRTIATDGRQVVLFDTDGTPILTAGPDGLVDVASFRPLLGTLSADVRYRRASDDGEVLGAVARVPGRALAVAMAMPVESIDAGASEIRRRTSYIAGVTLLGALVFGVLLAGSVTEPVQALRDAARRMEGGDLTSRVPLTRSDELGQLATAFNRMAEALEQNQHDLARKNAEIEGFNVELQDRVDRRTAELKAAQASLVQSRQLAAVAELSAGLTHELNNPLAGVVGLLQVLKGRSEVPDPLLVAAEQEALRCTGIVGRLSRFTQAPAAEPGERQDVDVDALMDDVLALMAGAIRDRHIAVVHPPGVLTVRGEQAALGRALGQLVAAVRTLAPEGATLAVRVVERTLEVSLAPVATSQDDWRAASLGFWAARQVFEEHGALVEEPRPGAETATWRVRFQ